MLIRRFMLSLRGWLPSPFSPAAPEVLDRQEFHSELARQHARADRATSELSLIILDLSTVPWGNLRLQDLLVSLRGRVRETDAVGWFDRRGLALLLPDTGAQGALELAAELRDTMQNTVREATWRIYCHPEERLPLMASSVGGARVDRRRDPGSPSPGAASQQDLRRPRVSESVLTEDGIRPGAERGPRRSPLHSSPP